MASIAYVQVVLLGVPAQNGGTQNDDDDDIVWLSMPQGSDDPVIPFDYWGEDYMTV